jgi:hypothetical protein
MPAATQVRYEAGKGPSGATERLQLGAQRDFGRFLRVGAEARVGWLLLRGCIDTPTASLAFTATFLSLSLSLSLSLPPPNVVWLGLTLDMRRWWRGGGVAGVAGAGGETQETRRAPACASRRRVGRVGVHNR